MIRKTAIVFAFSLILIVAAVVLPGLNTWAEEAVTTETAEPTASETSGTEASETNEDATVTTGDATATADVTNSANSNVVETGTADEEPAAPSEESAGSHDGERERGDRTEDTAGTSSSTPGTSETTDTADDPPPQTSETQSGTPEHISTENACVVPDAEETEGTSERVPRESELRDGTLDVENNNAACVDNALQVDALTGTNSASSTANATVDTGNASAFANLVNFLNSNFLNSTAFAKFLNNLGNSFEDIKLSFSDPEECTSFGCTISNLSVKNNNFAELNNNVNVSAATGGNSAIGESASVETGDAFAAANVVNFVNTNFVDANFLAFIMNTFGSWSGDLILPTGEHFVGGCPNCGGIGVQNNNSGNISNGVGVGADSGGNSTSGTNGGLINTGNAEANANVMTIANMNLLGSNALLVFIHTGSNWSGQVFGLPNNVKVHQTPNGIIIDTFGILEYIEPEEGESNISTPETNSRERAPRRTLSYDSENIAVVNNQINVQASTGDNTAHGERTAVNTGNAYAAANVANVVNTNVIGMNWLFAMINVFGEWNGDISFGQPDLWLGGAASSVSSPLAPGGEIEFTYTYRNTGNSNATNVTINDALSPWLSVIDARGASFADGHISWNVGSVVPGGTGAVSYLAKVASEMPYGTIGIENIATVHEAEPDANTADNTERLALSVNNVAPGGGNGGGGSGEPRIWPMVRVDKMQKQQGNIKAGEKADYVVKIENFGSGEAHNVLVVDTLRDSKGKTINFQQWDLGTLHSNEEVIIEYTVEFSRATPADSYENTVFVEGKTVWNAHIDLGSDRELITVIAADPETLVSSSLSEAVASALGGSDKAADFHPAVIATAEKVFGKLISEEEIPDDQVAAAANFPITDEASENRGLALLAGNLSLTQWLIMLALIIIAFGAYHLSRGREM